MNLHQAQQIFLSHLEKEREKVAHRRLEQTAKSENLDNFRAVESSEPEIIEYSTTHGFRVLCPDCFQHCPLGNRPQANQFVITKKGNGFAKARNLPYIYLRTLCEPTGLTVECPCIEAIGYGYATAMKLPYTIAGIGHDYPEGTLVVCVSLDNERAAACYANAIPLPYSPDSVYIQKIDMLDTEYAAMLDNVSSF